MTEAIETQGLTKDYGNGRGVFDLDLAVEDGEVFGFLGPNGAGKTTTIRQLMGLIHPTRGSARIFGLDCERDAVAVKRKVGYCPGELPQFDGWRGSEVVGYVAGLRGDVETSAIKVLAERLDLDLGRRYREYSHGNKQKLALVLAFMHKPLLVILDEPTSGLDPLHQQEFYGIVRDARAGGATIFVSSHVLSEVEHICDRVGIVREGRLVTVSKLDDLIGMRAFHVEIQFADSVPTDQLRGVPGLEQLNVEDHRASAILRGSFEPLMSVLAGRRVMSLVSREPSLEEIFLTYYQTKR
jgi:ABC-type multidrug transport system ATPase subunit